MARRQTPLRSGAFRFALAFAGIFAVSAFLLLDMVHHQVGRYSHEATVGALTTETAVLLREDRGHLVAAIRQRMAAAPDGGFLYLLRDPAGRRLVGTIPDLAARVGWNHVVMSEHAGAVGRPEPPERLRTLGTRLADGSLLVVATDGYDVARLGGHMARFTILWGLAMTLLALLGGWWVGRLFLARLDAVNAAVDRVMAGRLDERLPPIGLAPELDALSLNLNRMLDRIGGLVEGLRQVSTDVAHDLRTPLTRLRQRLELARETTGIDETVAGIDDAIAQADQVLATFRAILRLAQIEGGGRRATFAPVNLGTLFGALIETYEPVATDAGHRLDFAERVEAVVVGDADLLTQLFANLIENAIIHTPAGTVVSLAVTSDGESIMASVSDDGPGVPEAERARVTRRFYQMDASRGGGSAGLGLALASAIAHLHGASLEIADAVPGLRVTVTFAGTRKSGSE